MQKPICPYCKSENVNIDANAEWDYEKQEWVLQNTFEDAFCIECEETIKHLEWIKEPINETSEPVFHHPV